MDSVDSSKLAARIEALESTLNGRSYRSLRNAVLRESPADLIPELIRHLNSAPDGRAFDRIARVLAEIGTDEAFSALAVQARVQRRWARTAVRALGLCKHPDTITVLIDLLTNGRMPQRRSAAMALAKLKSGRAVEPLCVAAGQHNRGIGPEARASLKRMGRPATLGLMALADTNLSTAERVRALVAIREARLERRQFYVERFLENMSHWSNRLRYGDTIHSSVREAFSLYRMQTTYLRPAEYVGEDVLLRAAGGPQRVDSDSLLRASMPDDSDETQPSRLGALSTIPQRILRLFRRSIVALLMLVCLAPAAHAESVVRIEIVPNDIVLSGRESRRLLLINGYCKDGRILDLTGQASLQSSNDRVVKLTNSVALPSSNGSASITARSGGLTARCRVQVTGFDRRFSWSFENHVESVLSKQGCNTGPCHGAAAGKGGFRLTLRAYDPELDYARIAREGQGRRISRTDPARSLILRKPSLGLTHVGGLRLRRDSLEYRVLAEWIAAGSPAPTKKTPTIVALDVYPKERELAISPNHPIAQSPTQQLSVTARFSDGHNEDVTHWARYASNEDPIARVDDTGRITMRSCGETAISVWYLGKVAFARVRAPFLSGVAQRPNNPTTQRPAHEAQGFIDHLIAAKLDQLHLPNSRPCTDSEFVRRAYLDTCGILPTADETRAFLADKRPDKRTLLIDSLLDRPDYVDHWTYKFSDLLRINRDALGGKGMWTFHSWLHDCLERNVPWNEMVREILAARGSTATNGPANFYKMGSRPEEFCETVTQTFLGIRVQCAKCHNHPFEKWTQSDYYRMANFFSRVGVDENKRHGGALIYAKEGGEVDHPKLGRPLPPRAFDGPELALDSRVDRRDFLADWAAAPGNPYLARAIVNRIWKHYMGRGLVEPVDDMRLTNPPSNEPLFDMLVRQFIAHAFDMKWLTRQILRSSAYQRSSATVGFNKLDDRFYSHYLPRRITAETLLDAVCQVTGQQEKYDGVPRGVRALSLPDTRVKSDFMDIFGRPARQTTCECERNMEPNVAQALHLISAETLNKKVSAKGGIIDRLLESRKTDPEIIAELYLTALGRPATPTESAGILRAVSQAGKDRRQVYVDLLWALLSGPEFVFNH